MHGTGVMQFMEMITIIYKILIAYLMNQLLMICLLKLQMEASLHQIIGEKLHNKIDNNLINQNGTLSHFGNDFTLIYRIYGPNLNYYENPISIPVASIINTIFDENVGL